MSFAADCCALTTHQWLMSTSSVDMLHVVVTMSLPHSVYAHNICLSSDYNENALFIILHFIICKTFKCKKREFLDFLYQPVPLLATGKKHHKISTRCVVEILQVYFRASVWSGAPSTPRWQIKLIFGKSLTKIILTTTFVAEKCTVFN